jgi:hypothetical protein
MISCAFKKKLYMDSAVLKCCEENLSPSTENRSEVMVVLLYIFFEIIEKLIFLFCGLRLKKIVIRPLTDTLFSLDYCRAYLQNW